MSQHSKDLTGVLFRNDKKKTDKHPDYKGHVIVNDVKFWLAGWIKKAEGTGQLFLSLALTPERKEPAGSKVQGQLTEEDIPFQCTH